MRPQRRLFPPPWIVEERPACFIVKDANGQELAFVQAAVLSSCVGFDGQTKVGR
ncbi:MAG: hypothetical protein WA268_04300 [Xanthobacteraceae bacterium]